MSWVRCIGGNRRCILFRWRCAMLLPRSCRSSTIRPDGLPEFYHGQLAYTVLLVFLPWEGQMVAVPRKPRAPLTYNSRGVLLLRALGAACNKSCEASVLLALVLRRVTCSLSCSAPAFFSLGRVKKQRVVVEGREGAGPICTDFRSAFYFSVSQTQHGSLKLLCFEALC